MQVAAARAPARSRAARRARRARARRPPARPPGGRCGTAPASAARAAARAADARPPAAGARATSSPCAPAARSASTRTSSAASRCSSRRAISAGANGSPQARQRRPAPQLQRLAQHAARALGLAGRQRRAPLRNAAREALGVELARAHPQPVARRAWWRPPPGPPAPCAAARRAPAPSSSRPPARPRPTTPTARRSALTGSLACSSSTASTARGLRAPTATAPSSPCTSSGPRIRNSIALRVDATAAPARPRAPAGSRAPPGAGRRARRRRSRRRAARGRGSTPPSRRRCAGVASKPVLGEERMIGRQALGLEDVDPGARDPAGRERLDERGVVDDRSARGVQEVGGRLHRREEVPVDEAARVVAQREVQRDEVRAPRELEQGDGLGAGRADALRGRGRGR